MNLTVNITQWVKYEATHPPCLSTMHTLAGFLRVQGVHDRL